jgi:hypothetical protein
VRTGPAEQGEPRGRCTTPGRRTAERLGTVGGPPWQLPAGLLTAAAAAQVAGTLLLIRVAGDLADGRFYGPSQLAAVHLLGLAFLSVAIIGALLQLVPVVLRQQVATPATATAVGVVFAGGAWALSAGFLLERDLAVATGGTLIVAAGGALVVLLARVLRAATRDRTLGAPGVALAASTAWFALVLAMGGLMAANFVSPFLSVDRLHLIASHATVALLGWVGGTILAVSLKLAPMFALAHGRHPRLGPVAVTLWHIGVAPLALGLLLGNATVAAAGTVVVAIACVIAGAFVVDVARSRRRRIEAPLAHLAVGLAAVTVACAIALHAWWLDGDPVRAATAAGLLVLIAFATGVTSGHLFKVVPMLVWTGRYAHLAGTPGAPRLSDLYPALLARVEQAAFAAGSVLLVVAVLAGSPSVALAGATLLFTAALAVAAAVGACIATTAHAPASHPVPAPAATAAGHAHHRKAET